MTACDVWKLKFDETFNQYYYVNTTTDAISFDLPCEVKSKHIKNNSNNTKLMDHLTNCIRNNKQTATTTKQRGVLSRIGSAFSMKSTKSNDSNMSSSSTLTEQKQNQQQPSSHSNTTLRDPGYISGLDDEYLLQPSFNLNKHSLGMQYDSDLDSVLSDDSIHSYYSDMDRDDVYHDYVYTEPEEDLSFDKEKERQELRMQFMKELQI